MVYGLSVVIMQYPVIRVLGRYDHMLLMSLSCVAQSLGMGLAAFVPWPATLACVVSIGLGIVLLIPISSTVVSCLAPVELRGRYMGVWTLVYMGGYATGPLLGGLALDALGGRGAFVLLAAAGLLGALLFPLLRRWRRSRRRRPTQQKRSAASCAANVPSRRCRWSGHWSTGPGRRGSEGDPPGRGRRPGQARRVFARITMATAMKTHEASAGCQTGAHHSCGSRKRRSRAPSDDGQRRSTHSQT